ncbi:MAG: PLP-dependent aspartate aminotransferase family protein [Haloarculaceae archaeon]
MTDDERCPGDLDTRGIHGGQGRDQYGALTTPIYANVTYEYDSPTDLGGPHRYSRMSEPTRDDLEALLADLEGGSHASAFASGMAAIDAIFSLLSAGDHVVAGATLYAETHDLLSDVYPRYGVEVSHVDMTDPDAVRNAVREETALVYAESPTNPLLQITDLEAAAAVAREAGAVLAVDNTFASPALQRPLELGADLVVESLTKYLGGHSDAIAGAVATDDPGLAAELERIQYTRGAIPGPFECFLVRRGAKTLGARMDRHCRNARAVAETLAAAGAVDRVYYPGLESHPGHEIAADQMADFGGMLSFELAGGVEAATAFVAALKKITIAESLGGVESLIEVPAAMTHQDLSPAELAAAGIDEGLVRISVGIERQADLLADVRRGLDAV